MEVRGTTPRRSCALIASRGGHISIISVLRVTRWRGIDKKTVPDPVRWTLGRIKRELPSMFWKAGHRKLGKEIHQSVLARAVAKVEKEIIRLSQG